MRSLGLIQMSCLGAGYEAIQSASLNSQIEILEFIPLGRESQLLLEGPHQVLLDYRKNLRTADLEKSVIIENPDPRLLKAYYHLENSKIEDFIFILESDFAGYLLEAAQSLLNEKVQIVDFRQPRVSGSLSSFVLTGQDASRIEHLVSKVSSKKIRVSFVEKPSIKVKSYFDLDPGK